MENTVSIDEMQEYLANISDFLESAEDSFKKSIILAEEKVIEQSKAVLGDDFLEVKRLLMAIINFIHKCKSGIKGNSNENTSEILTLIVNYYQSVSHTENLLLKGQYIAAAALMKKDFETMVKLREIRAGKAKYGKTPNANHAPNDLKFIYGQLNDLAHISKSHVIGFYLEKKDDRSESGVTASPQFKKEQFESFYTYHIAIMVNIVTEAITEYKEVYGIDENYKKMRIYLYIANDILNKIAAKKKG